MKGGNSTFKRNTKSSSLKNLENQTILKGSWIFKDDNITKDEICQEIEDLMKNYLAKIKTDESGLGYYI